MDQEVSNHWTQGKLEFPHDHISTQLQVFTPVKFHKTPSTKHRFIYRIEYFLFYFNKSQKHFCRSFKC